MLSTVQSSWQVCRDFVAKTCAGRPATHGLPHMEHVTHLSLLIASLEGVTDATMLRDIAIVAMLHDVADHKYDHDGTLETRVRAFLLKDVFQGDIASHAADEMLWKTVEAISYSKEKKRGMRWYEATLGAHWTRVRDIVSDADKILAIGEDGLARCWAYQFEIHEHAKTKNPNVQPITPESVKADVVQHADDKLLHLMSQFIVTPSGKFLAAPKQAEMEAVLEHWKTSPPTTLAYSGILM